MDRVTIAVSRFVVVVLFSNPHPIKGGLNGKYINRVANYINRMAVSVVSLPGPWEAFF